MNQKIKSLATKITSLRLELEASRNLANTASQEVDKMFNEVTEIGQTREEETESAKQTKPKTKENDPKLNAQPDIESKKAFRQIALKAHPDKLIGISDTSELKRKTDLYQKAQKAMADQDLLILADISIDLGIRPPEITDNHIKKTIDEINSIKKEINHIESTYVWKWLFCSDKEQKEKLLKKMFELMQKKYETENPRP